MKSFIFLCACFFAFPSLTHTQDIYSIIMRGDVAQARRILTSQTPANASIGDNLFFQSLLERRAVRSAELLKSAISKGLAPRFQEEAHLRLAQFYFAKHDAANLAKVSEAYRSQWPQGSLIADMTRFVVMADEWNSREKIALKTIDQFLLEHKRGPYVDLATIDKARLLASLKKQLASYKPLKDLARQKSGLGVSQALYLLTNDALAQGKTDDAVFYYNILREAYPSSIGLDAIVDNLAQADMSQDTKSAEKAARLTGTYYAVKIGVFSSKENAKRQVDLFNTYSEKMETEDKNISGKRYHIVYIGRFASFEKATTFKEMLEERNGEAYQVVAR
ncbi:MAG: SPOR domain-containing protein [candidate division Zixibacteria bacterium]|nr:SPOR domain-containing protein [candidate division Zixibacteria bacterium]